MRLLYRIESCARFSNIVARPSENESKQLSRLSIVVND